MSANQFPVLLKYGERRCYPNCPLSIPWAMLTDCETQARANHGGQTLAKLAERGGLGPREILNVLDGRNWKPGDEDDSAAVASLIERVDAWVKRSEARGGS